MAILDRAAACRVRRSVALACAAVSLGVALAWLQRPAPPDAVVTRPPIPVEPVGRLVAPPAVPMESGCDARCVAAKVIVPATTACAAAVEELAGFGVRWLDADAASAKFDRFSWLLVERGTVTFAGGRTEFRNAAGAPMPVEYDCDFGLATLPVLQARARPRSATSVAKAGPATH